MTATQTPAAEAPLFAVVYDISDDRERRRVDRLLQGFGFRVQRSVFECRLTPGAHRRLAHQLGLLALRSGFVRIYRVLGTAAATSVGAVPGNEDDAHAYVVNWPAR